MAWILLNKRLTAIIALVVLLILQTAYVNHLAGKLKKAEAKCEAEKKEIYDANRKAHEASSKEINRLSELYEIEKSKERVINNERIKEVQTIIRDNPIYTDCKLTDSVYTSLREATTSE